MESSAIIKAPRHALRVLPDDKRYKCRFEVKSSSSDRVHRISFDSAAGAGYWTCSCQGCIRYGSCKHLEAAGLRGRKFGQDLKTIRQLENAGVI